MMVYGVYAVIIIMGMYLGKIYVKYKFKKIALETIRKNYGTRKHMEKDYLNHDEGKNNYFFNFKEEDFYIDDITWNDFNMEEIFKIMANTNSSIGSEYLYKALRMPIFNKVKLDKRRELIRFFKENMQKREKVALMIRAIGRKNSAHLSDYFSEENRGYKLNLNLVKAMRYSLAILLVLGVIEPIFFLLLIINAIANMIFHMRIEKRLEYKMQDYSYMIRMVEYAEEIWKKI